MLGVAFGVVVAFVVVVVAAGGTDTQICAVQSPFADSPVHNIVPIGTRNT